LAQRAEAEHAAGRPFKVSVFTGASTNDCIDGALARAVAIDRRTPYQSSKDSRKGINSGEINYFDMHLSELAQTIRYDFLKGIDVAIIEAADVTDDGEITLGTGVGAVATFARLAKTILIELNTHLPKEIKGMHDIYEPADLLTVRKFLFTSQATVSEAVS
jgi:Acetyl-CoA hydrolase